MSMVDVPSPISPGAEQDAELAALAALATTGLVVRTGTAAYTTRNITGPAAGITIGNGSGVAANPSISLANDLAALEGLGSTGIAIRSGVDTWVQRSIAGTANEITLTNGDGVSGNPTISLPSALTFTGKTVTGGTFNATAISIPTFTAGSVLFAGASGVFSENNSKLFWDITNSRLGINTASPTNGLSVTKTDSFGDICQRGYGFSPSCIGDLALGTVGVPLPPNSGNTLISFLGRGYDTVTFGSGGRILIAAGGTFSTTSHPGYIRFDTTAIGSVALTERMRLTSNGILLINTTTETASGGLIQLATGTTAAFGILAGTDTNLYRSAADTWKTDDVFTIADTTASSSSSTGALIVSGGAGFAKDVNINGLTAGKGANAISTNTAFGSGVLASGSLSGGNNIAIGNSPLDVLTSGTNNIAIGTDALGAVTTVSNLVAVGYEALKANTSGTANTAIGYQAGKALTTGNYNTAVGNTAMGLGVVSSDSNTAIGVNALYNLAGGSGGNFACGTNALFSNTTGANNVAIGVGAGYYIQTGGFNVCIGAAAMTGTGVTTAQRNVMIGASAGNSITNSANNNVGIGYSSLDHVTSGANNIAIGYQAANALTTGANNICIGYDIDLPSATGSYQLNIAGVLTADITAGVAIINMENTTSAVNYHSFKASTTTNAIEYKAAGSDTNIDMAFTPKGTGLLKFGSYSALGAEALAGYITIKDSGGTSRKIGVIA